MIAGVEKPSALIPLMEAFSAYKVTKIKYLKLEGSLESYYVSLYIPNPFSKGANEFNFSL